MNKRVMAALALVVLASPAVAQQEISLVGTWSGERHRSAKVEGYRTGLSTLVVTEQRGRAFKGYLKRSNPDGDAQEDLWGAFTPGVRLAAGADEEGFYSFLLLNENTLDYCYTQSGKSPRAVCGRLVRKR
jgi:hypothetical protein